MENMTAQEVANLLKVTDQQVHKLCRAGRLPYLKYGKLYRFPLPAWKSWQEQMVEQALEMVKEEDHAKTA